MTEVCTLWAQSKLLLKNCYCLHYPVSFVPVIVGKALCLSPVFVTLLQCLYPGFNLSRQQWSLLNHFRTEQGHCGACRRKWRLTDIELCTCGETKTMSHIVESCPLTKLNGGLSRLHSADEDAVSWLTSYSSWNAYEKKKKNVCICVCLCPARVETLTINTVI